MEDFSKRVAAHSEHVKRVGAFCTTEETTKQALILPLLDILGFSAFDPTKVRAEHTSDFAGVKAGERVDYALFSNGMPVMFIEAKSYRQELTNHCPQLSRYFNATPNVTLAAITNGREWRFFTDLVHKNIMDEKPFMTLQLEAWSEELAPQLLRFHHDQFQPDELRALAEENTYLAAFKEALTVMLKDCDADFVKYVATRAKVQRNFTTKFVDGIQPLVKQAIAQSVSEMVASSLAKPPVEEIVVEVQAPPEPDPNAPQVDPDNPKIITTALERKLLEVCRDVLAGEDLQGRDNESYYAVSYAGKSNRWLVRYWGDKKRPSVQFGFPLTASHLAEVGRAKLEIGASETIYLSKPEDLLRLSGLLTDALEFCKNDENFRRKSDPIGISSNTQ